MIENYFPQLLHGGDYNPDQWLDHPEILAEDIEFMKKAHVNVVSLGIFAWAKLEPEENVYSFDWLEEIIDNLYANGIYTFLATPTGGMPRWLTDNYPEVNQMDANGIRRIHGQRHNFCPTSPFLRERVRRIDGELSKRFGKKDAVIGWHISNEYGGDNRTTECHCPSCQKQFQNWLKDRYETVKNLNKAWWAGFWSNDISDFTQIHSPNFYGEYTLHGLKLDWRRFMSDSYISFCENEIAAVRKYSNLPVITNLMGAFKPINYFKLAKSLDIVSLDNYPFWHSEENEENVTMRSAFSHTLMRSLKRQPYLLMESVPSVVNWIPRCSLKRPGMHELSSLQAIACGSNSVQYFQWRKGRGASEKYHGAVVDHKNGCNTRVFRDVTTLGERLENISNTVLKTCNNPKVALVFDWENWWAADDAQSTLFPFDYFNHWIPYFKTFFELGIEVDIVDMDSDISDYRLVVAPINYMYRGNYEEKVRHFISNGGTYVTTYWSGEVDDSDLCFTGSHPLRDVLGIRTEEIDIRPEYTKNYIQYNGKSYDIVDFCALVHAEDAMVLGTYQEDFYAGMPAVTKNSFGKGNAFFLAAEGNDAFLHDFFKELTEELDTACKFQGELMKGVYVSERQGEESKIFFVQNFNSSEAEILLETEYRNIETGDVFGGKVTMKPYEVFIVEEV